MKATVKDFNSITSTNYINAGEEGMKHFNFVPNCVIDNVVKKNLEPEINLTGPSPLTLWYLKPWICTSGTCTNTNGTQSKPILNIRVKEAPVTWHLSQSLRPFSTLFATYIKPAYLTLGVPLIWLCQHCIFATCT